MRIQTVTNLQNNLDKKVFYVVRTPYSEQDLTDCNKCSTRSLIAGMTRTLFIFPCKLVRRIDEDLNSHRQCGYRFWKPFSCVNSVVYEFVPLTYDEAKKAGVDECFKKDYFGTIYQFLNPEKKFVAHASYMYLTMEDGQKFASYTENMIESQKEDESMRGSDYVNTDDNLIVYDGGIMQTPIRAFTTVEEAEYCVQEEVYKWTEKEIDEINKHADERKEMLFNFKKSVEQGYLY